MMHRKLSLKAVFVAATASIVVSFAPTASSRPATYDTLLMAADALPISILTDGLAGAGLAIVDGVSSVKLNPALLNAFLLEKGMRATGAVRYGRDEQLFRRHIFSTGVAGKTNEQNSAGFVYTYARASTGRLLHEAIVNASGMLFQDDTGSGRVDVGINLRYQGMSWRTRGFDSLWTVHHPVGSDTPFTRTHNPYNSLGESKDHRLLLDLGFYQKKVSDAIDFGLVFHNMFGYLWHSGSPSVQTVDSIPVGTDSLADSTFYSPAASKSRGWIDKYYKGISCGINYHALVGDGNLLLQIPLDVKVIGLLDRSPHFSVHTGIEAIIAGSYILRFGYARTPDDPISLQGKPKNVNIIAGGAGFSTDHLGIDFAFRKRSWGASVNLFF